MTKPKKNKKIEDILIESDNPNLYLGLNQSVTKASSTSLTEENLNKMFEYIKSDEYAQKEQEQFERIAWGSFILAEALGQGVITQKEFYRLYAAMQINGGLIVSSEMYKRLRKVKLPKTYEQKNK